MAKKPDTTSRSRKKRALRLKLAAKAYGRPRATTALAKKSSNLVFKKAEWLRVTSLVASIAKIDKVRADFLVRAAIESVDLNALSPRAKREVMIPNAGTVVITLGSRYQPLVTPEVGFSRKTRQQARVSLGFKTIPTPTPQPPPPLPDEGEDEWKGPKVR